MTTTPTREQLYDEKIEPLMGKVRRLCKEHDIPILAVFELTEDRGDDERKADDSTLITIANLPEDADPNLLAAYAEIPREAATTTKTRGGKVVAAETHE